MRIEYTDIKQHFANNSFQDGKVRKCSLLLHTLEEFTDVNTLELFYPKNLFVYDKNLKAYLFFDDKILIGRFLENSNIEILVLRFKDLTDLKCECICGRGGFHRLTCNFSNGEMVVFDNEVDTNTSWSDKFDKQIRDILKHLINKI